MAGRIRSIKPEILEDEKTAALSHLAWRLFVSLWLIADDYGNLRGDPVYVLGQTLWAANETRDTVGAALDELAAVALIARYTVRGQSYCHIAGWSKHQKVTHPGKPRMPGPDGADIEPSREVETLAESSGDSRETLTPDLRPPTSDLRPREGARARAIPPVPERAPTPAVSPPATAREDIARTFEASKSTAPSQVSGICEPTIGQLWTELEQARARAAEHHGVTLGPLLAHDARRHDLAELLAEAARVGERPRLVGQIRHAIAVAEAEAMADVDQLQWLSGAVFAERNFGRLVAAPAPKKRKQPRAAAKSAEQSLQVSTLTPEERLAALAADQVLLARLTADGARAPPASARQSDDDTQQEPGKAAAT